MVHGIVLVRRAAADTQAVHLQQSAGFIFISPENLGTASGEMKEFFDRNYYAMFDPHDEECSLLLGRPYGLAIGAPCDCCLPAE